MYLEILAVLVLTLVNGVLAMSELAVVSSRPARLKVLADRGSAGAVRALALLENPGKFLSAMQVGITLIGILSGAVSGATLGQRLAQALDGMGVPSSFATPLGVGSVVALITYLSLILGELVPKQIALRDPEAVAARVAPAMSAIAAATRPIVWFLDISGRTVLRLLGQSGEAGARMTDEEVKMTMIEAEQAGVFAPGEREMLQGVMRLADRTASGLMTPRHEVEVLDLAEAPEVLLAQLADTRHNRLPVRDGSEEEITGFIAVREAMAMLATETPPLGELVERLRALVREAPVVMDITDAGTVIERLKTFPGHILLVFDEYGHFEGVITAMDLLQAIAGLFEDGEDHEPALVERADGSLLVSGWMPVDEFADYIGIAHPEGDFDTVAGLVIDRLRHLPQLGESFESEGWRFEIIDLDGRRIDKLLVSRA